MHARHKKARRYGANPQEQFCNDDISVGIYHQDQLTVILEYLTALLEYYQSFYFSYRGQFI